MTPTMTRSLTSLVLGGFVLVTACTDPGPEVVEVETPAQTAPAPKDTTDGGPSPTAGESAPDPAADEAISQLSLCGADSFDEGANACAGTDSEVTTNGIYCAGMADVASAGPVSFELVRDGMTMLELDLELAADDVGGQLPLWAELSLGEMTLPAGLWECQITLPDGTQASVKTSLDGPTQTFSQGRSCDEDDTFNDEYTSHCLQDQPDLPINTDEVGCSSVVVAPRDAALELWVDYDTDSGAGERRVGSLPSEFGVTVVHITMTSAGLLDAAEFSPGDYSCRVMLDDEELGSHDFTMS